MCHLSSYDFFFTIKDQGGYKPQVDDSSNLPRPGQGGKPQVEARNPISTPRPKMVKFIVKSIAGFTPLPRNVEGSPFGG